MSSQSSQPGKSASLEQQLDALLTEIETTEPGTVEADALPASFETEQDDTHADASSVNAEAEIDALLNGPPADSATDEAEPAPAEPESDASPADQAPDPEQADMLAALNSALQGLSNDAPDDDAGTAASSDNDAQAVTTETPEQAEPMSMEDKLQQEIASLMSAEPEAAPGVTTASAEDDDDEALEGSFESPESLAHATQAPSDSPSTEDQIAMEIEGLLNPSEPADTTATPTQADTAIDELDKMLAQEIDDDDELAGDFQSVEDATAGIKIEDSAQHAEDDEHAATAREVAAELDSQPEDLPAPPPAAAALEPGEDPFAVISEIADVAEQNEKEHKQRQAKQAPDWQHLLEVGKERLLNLCYLLNWPARRFLTAEWRANLGYIALLNLFFGVGLWIVLIVF